MAIVNQFIVSGIGAGSTVKTFLTVGLDIGATPVVPTASYTLVNTQTATALWANTDTASYGVADTMTTTALTVEAVARY